MSRSEFYKEQIDLEEHIIEKAEQAVSNVKNPMIRNIILGISLDSQKHKLLLNAMIAKFEESTPFIDEQKNKELRDNLKEHIELEQQAINTYKKLLNELDDDENADEKALVKAIYQDELRHHALLKKLHKAIIDTETFDEEDVFQTYWKDSFTHGSPGG